MKKCAHTLRHSSLLAKLATSDMLALAAVYHLHCVTALHNEERAYERTTISDEVKRMINVIMITGMLTL